MRPNHLIPTVQTVERRQARRRATDQPQIHLLRLTQVLEISGLARTSVYEVIKDGVFPPPVHPYGRATRWVNAEVNDWLCERLSARYNRQPGIDAPGDISVTPWVAKKV